MLENLFIDNVLFALAVWIILYVADYYLTIYGARLYRANAQEHLILKGSYELTPVFRRDVDALKMVSVRFLAFVVLSSICIALIWLLSVQFLELTEPYLFTLGVLMLREAVVHLRHWRNITIFRVAAQPNAVEGKIAYSRWTSYTMSANELFSFAVLYFLLALTMNSWLILGGAFACAVTSVQHRLYARRVKTASTDRA